MPTAVNQGARVVLVVRQSPDWDALAADHARGLRIAPSRYLPPQSVMFFPAHIEACIARWNASYGVDFFTCRARLRAIARKTLEAVPDAVILTYADIPHRIPRGDFRLFFVDDDDWFAPDAAARIEGVGDADVAVFPLPRLDVPVFTFCRGSPPPGVAVGAPVPAPMRYMTNNYGLHPRLCGTAEVLSMADHGAACAEGDRRGLRDDYVETVVSATNKTPASASVVERIIADGAQFHRHLEAFVAGLDTLSLPPHAGWMREPVRRTAELFLQALG